MLQQKSTAVGFALGFVMMLLGPGCSGNSDEPQTPARIELGAGRVDFVALDEGGAIELVSGPQGGHHLEFTLRLFDVDPEDLVLDYQVHETTSKQRVSLPARYVITKATVLDRGDHFLRVGDRAVLDVKSAMAAQDMDVEVSCRIEREGATLAEDKKKTTIVDEINELGL